MSVRKLLICDRCGAQERAATATQPASAMREYAQNHSGWNEIPYVGDFCASCARNMTEEREALTQARTQRVDRAALDAIAELMSGEEWSADTLDSIAEWVRSTGREINDFDPDETVIGAP